MPLAGRGLLAIGLRSREQLGFRRNRDAAKFWLFAGGVRDDYYGLVIACMIGFVLSGLRPPQQYLVFSALFLTGAWASATRRWPYQEENEDKDPGSSAG